MPSSVVAAAKVLAFLAVPCSGAALEVHGVGSVKGRSLYQESNAQADHGDSLTPLSTNNIDHMFDEADTDQDGKLSWSEVLQNAKVSRLQEVDSALKAGRTDEATHLAWDVDSEQHLKALFTKCDEDHDGALNKDEMAHLSAEENEEDDDGDKQGAASADLEQDSGSEDREQGGEAPEKEQHSEEDDEDTDGAGASLLQDAVRSFMSSADTSHDGMLSLAEVEAQVDLADGQELASQFGFDSQSAAQDRFTAGDTDKNGLLDVHELGQLHDEVDDSPEAAALIETESRPDRDSAVVRHEGSGDQANEEMQEVKETFDVIDTDRDGTISWKDVEDRMSKATDVGAIKEDFMKADENKDGHLDLNDFAHFVNALTHRIGNGIGQLFPMLVTLPEHVSS